MAVRLKGKVAIITGAGKGLGRAIALGFAREGARVVVNDQPGETQAQEVVSAIQNAGGEAMVIHADTSRKEQVKSMVDRVVAKWERIDILVNNAGIMYSTPFLDIPEEEWDRLMSINLKGYFLCGQSVGRVMAKQGGGKIINISSTRQVQAWPGNASYCASKGAIYMLTRVMAVELAPYGIQVNSIAPGTIPTNLNPVGWDDEELRNERIARIPVGRLGTPEDLVGAALLFASDESSFINGASLMIDGGQTIW
ncbi:3-oxoacyl-ACP reductase FabG [Alicyclobacillus fastidiosus]|uniref:3-oxoacyl-ACP reductase FabG n=1 Tax=Alicyclobacillus fastidiosus TaxID=392011 RepID=A0ABY6ZJS8_9BACL|nr:3-oxoacyl-ACP reductase family protein [Alicyclobacillus fastidiosus]WAH43107.1 3-oxoacyl-ACP reductase FabG [Alicyclobacillus fastidiosus]GMA65108.1 glucose-1-dehydrogenase [Alicyclobacillus fastidiosus]